MQSDDLAGPVPGHGLARAIPALPMEFLSFALSIHQSGASAGSVRLHPADRRIGRRGRTGKAESRNRLVAPSVPSRGVRRLDADAIAGAGSFIGPRSPSA